MSCDVCFYDGSFDGLSNLYDTWNSSSFINDVNLPELIIAIDGNNRIRTLSNFENLQWKQISHSQVGGISTITVWVGFSSAFRSDSTNPRPKYSNLVIQDLLEFAPCGVHVTPFDLHDLPAEFISKVHQLCAFSFTQNIWYSHGLFSASAFLDLDLPLPQVVCSTPYTPNKVGFRNLTTTELCRVMDLPAAFETRLDTLYGSYASHDIPIFSSVPTKILLHVLWLCEVLELSVHISPSATTASSGNNENDGGYISPSPQLMVSQEIFDLSNDKINKVDVNATKMDSAAIPVHLWNNRLLSIVKPAEGFSTEDINFALDKFRMLALKWWKRNVLRSFLKYLKLMHMFWWGKFMNGARDSITLDSLPDIKAGVDCLVCVQESTWWEWKNGSRPLFWRWPYSFRILARDGIPVCWTSNKRLNNRKLQPKVIDALVKEQMKDKIASVRRKRYIQDGYVESLIRFFPVPKGNLDIRMVYDGTDSGFNSLVWIQSFGLPTISTLLRGTSPTTWIVDLDISEQFLNFCLHHEASKYVGVDLTNVFSEELSSAKSKKVVDRHNEVVEKKSLWERYTRCAMGLKILPNHAIRATLRAEEFMTSFPWLPSNPFRYSRIVSNLPGTHDYSPAKPWFFLQRKDGSMASVLAIYVDDQRVHAPSENDAYQAARQIASRESYLGIQDAARKRRAPSQQAGAWAGSILRTNNHEVGLLISENRWDKTKVIINKWYDVVHATEEPMLNTKELFSDRGFLVYICRTYEVLTPYLKYH